MLQGSVITRCVGRGQRRQETCFEPLHPLFRLLNSNLSSQYWYAHSQFKLMLHSNQIRLWSKLQAECARQWSIDIDGYAHSIGAQDAAAARTRAPDGRRQYWAGRLCSAARSCLAMACIAIGPWLHGGRSKLAPSEMMDAFADLVIRLYVRRHEGYSSSS
jgi:hypothetical protein